MADFKSALQARALADAGVMAIAGDRVTWAQRRRGEPLPALVLTIVSDPRPQHLKGFEAVRPTRVQADCMAEDAATASDLAEAFIIATAGPAEEDEVRFQRSQVEAVRDLSEETDTGFVHRQSVELLVWHREL